MEVQVLEIIQLQMPMFEISKTEICLPILVLFFTVLTLFKCNLL